MLNNSASEYERKHRVSLIAKLGDGKDGIVLSSNRDTAVKLFYDVNVYNRELRAYRVLQAAEIDEINGHHVPRLLHSDDDLRAIEMTIVVPPFLLDFAAAYTEDEVERFAFSTDVTAERESHWEEIFGDRWGEVIDLTNAFFARTGLMLLDLSLNNVRFE
jgi:hypothetical protein